MHTKNKIKRCYAKLCEATSILVYFVMKYVQKSETELKKQFGFIQSLSLGGGGEDFVLLKIPSNFAEYYTEGDETHIDSSFPSKVSKLNKISYSPLQKKLGKSLKTSQHSSSATNSPPLRPQITPPPEFILKIIEYVSRCTYSK